MHSPSLSPRQQARLKCVLRPGESIVWSGAPIAWRAMMPVFLLYFFAIPWTAFTLAWEGMAVGVATHGTVEQPGAHWIGWIFLIFGVPFVLIGFGMLAAPFYSYRKAKCSIYLITRERAIIHPSHFKSWRGGVMR